MKIDDKYKNAQRLNVCLDCDESAVHVAVRKLYSDLYKDVAGIQRRKRYAHLRVFLLNFIALLQSRPEGYIHYSRDLGNYWAAHNARYPNPFNISKLITEVADDLTKAGLVEHWTGIATYHKKYQSRIRPLDRFIARYIDAYDLRHVPVKAHKDTPLLRLKVKVKDREGSIVYPQKTTYDLMKPNHPCVMPETRKKAMVRTLKAYNKLLDKTDITLAQNKHTNEAHCAFGRKFVYRSFTAYANSDAPYSGRFNGGWWTQTRKKHRKHILINGSATVELDYKAQHPYMLYSFACGKDLAKCLDQAGPYIIYDKAQRQYPRGLAKDVFMMYMNGSGESRMRNVLLNGTPDQDFRNGYRHILKNSHDADKIMATKDKIKIADTKDRFEVFLGDFKKVHYALFEANAMFKDWWTMFQSFDADICNNIIESLTSQKIPVLTVHDSFIVAQEHKETLMDAMIQAYESHIHPSVQRALPPIVISA